MYKSCADKEDVEKIKMIKACNKYFCIHVVVMVRYIEDGIFKMVF